MKKTLLVGFMPHDNGTALAARFSAPVGCSCPFCDGRPRFPRQPSEEELRDAVEVVADRLFGARPDTLTRLVADRAIDDYLRNRLANIGEA